MDGSQGTSGAVGEGAGMITTPQTWEHAFMNGVKRDPGLFRIPIKGKTLNLGSGRAPMNGAINHDRPNWEAPFLDYHDNSIAIIHMHHFLEHLDPDTAIQMLRECDRVLKPFGCVFLTVPHAMCPLAYQAPDHKSFWTEEGLQDTFYSAGYDSAYGYKWQMDISWMMVAGVKWSNLCILAQLYKTHSGEVIDTPWRRS
jgi:SAM-dependent methyltransferase